MTDNNVDQDIEHARNRLDKKLVGYEHPEQNNRMENTYKVFSENDSDVYLSQTHNTYATFEAEEKLTEVQKTKICPICETEAMYSCPCPVKEMMCVNKHMWYVQDNGRVQIGDPHA